MKIAIGVALLASLVCLAAGCGGSRTRTPDDWRQDLGGDLQSRAGALKNCYDSAGLKTKVSVTLRLHTGKKDSTAGSSSPVSVEAADSLGAPSELLTCVKQVAGAIELRPGDTREAHGSWVIRFDPDVDPSVSSAVTTGPKS